MVMDIQPTPEELVAIGDRLGFEVTAEDAAFMGEALAPMVALANATMKLPDRLPEVAWPRTPGAIPEDNPLGAWYFRTEVKGAPDGPLKGKTAALKDNVLLAGVPMMNGASLMQGYLPEVDATVATRLLDAGATILGKAHCEYFCLTGSSFTSDLGPVQNPAKPGYAAGGSSSGSAALVAAGEVDMAIGGDQGGSIRIPASFCGIVGLKPTHGLVPYSGIFSMEVSIDHAGPMTRTVADNALMLEAIAGPDGWDMRQRDVVTHRYTDFVNRGAEGLRIAVVREGFGRPESDRQVDAAVHAAAERFAALGATVEEISVPMHDEIGTFFMPMIAEGMVRQLTFGAGLGSGAAGFYPRSLIDRNLATRFRSGEWPDNVKAMAMLGTFCLEKWGGRVYARGQNQRPWFLARFAEVFEMFDLLLMPTTAHAAPKLPDAEMGRGDRLAHAWTMLGNTAPYDYTGHPAISIPCGTTSEGLPIGLQLVGRHFDEPTIYRAAGAFEAAQAPAERVRDSVLA